MTDLAADLATLRNELRGRPWAVEIVDRVEAELVRLQNEAKHGERAFDQQREQAARLTRERDDLAAQVKNRDDNAFNSASIVQAIERRDAAEARCARLEQALRSLLDQRLQSNTGVNPDGSVSSRSMAECIAREALAGLDTPAEGEA